MNRIWAVFLIETSRNNSIGLVQIPACWKAENLTRSDGKATSSGGAPAASGTVKSSAVRRDVRVWFLLGMGLLSRIVGLNAL